MVKNIALYPFQVTAVSKANNALTQAINTLLVSPTGSGKTVMASDIINTLVKNDKKVLMIVNKICLLQQTSNTLKQKTDNFAIIHADVRKDIDGNKINNIAKVKKGKIIGLDKKPQVIITMVETFMKNTVHLDEFYPDVIIYDEAHKATSSSFQVIRDSYPNAVILGLTATPFRAQNDEGENLNGWYDKVIETVTIGELIKMGFLTKPRYVVEYNKDDKVAEVWARETAGDLNKRTLVFCRDTKHAIKILESFKGTIDPDTGIGIAAEIITTTDEHVGGKMMTNNQRNVVYKNFRDNKIQVLISINALCEGFDEPLAKYAMLLRPIGGEDDAKNPALYTQTVGRVLRRAKGKDEAVIIDFYNNVDRYGFVEDWIWNIEEQGSQTCSINSGAKIHSAIAATKRVYIKCDCGHVYNLADRQVCIHCSANADFTIVATYADLYGVSDFYEDYKKKGGKMARSTGLKDKFEKWANIQISETQFGECMTELEAAGKCKRRKVFMGIKAIWYE